ncbi:hypothetical protein ACWKX9_26990, partial [Enterobacter asburiae]
MRFFHIKLVAISLIIISSAAMAENDKGDPNKKFSVDFINTEKNINDGLKEFHSQIAIEHLISPSQINWAW